MTPRYKARCTALTLKGMPCQARAVIGSDPPLCGIHGGRARIRKLAQVAPRDEAPLEGDKAPLEGDEAPHKGDKPWFDDERQSQEPPPPPFPPLPPAGELATVDDAMRYLARNVILLDHVIVAGFEKLSVSELARLSSTQGMNLSRYVRMHRDKAVLNGDIEAQLEGDLAEALRMVSEQMEVQL